MKRQASADTHFEREMWALRALQTDRFTQSS